MTTDVPLTASASFFAMAYLRFLAILAFACGGLVEAAELDQLPKWIAKLKPVGEGHVRRVYSFPLEEGGAPVRVELVAGKKVKCGIGATVEGAKFSQGRTSRHFIVSQFKWVESAPMAIKERFVDADTVWLKRPGESIFGASRGPIVVVVDAPRDVEIRYRIWRRSKDIEDTIPSKTIAAASNEVAPTANPTQIEEQ